MPVTLQTAPRAVPPLPRREPAPPAPRAPRLHCGLPALDALRPFRPGTLTFVESATRVAGRVAHGLAVGAIAAGGDVAWADGANAVDVHALARLARAHGLDAESALDAVRLARGFTAYQLQEIIEEHLPGQVTPATGLVVAAGLPAMYTDEDVRASEAKALLRRALRALKRLAGEHDVPVVATHQGMAGLHRHPALRRLLHALPHEVVRLHPAAGRGLWAELPRRGARVHCPDPANPQTVLPHYGVQLREATA